MSKRAQLTGKVFGKLTVLGRGEDYISPSGSHLLRWECLCECGNKINATTSQLKRGLSSCGCVSRREDLTGRRFGKLTVKYAVDDYVSPKGSHMSKWHCVCDCSNEIDVIGMSLKNGDTQSCGQCGTSRKTTRISFDYSGKQFGELYVLQKVEDSHPPKYLCKCSCGREITVLQKELSSGKKTHCGCKTIRKKYVPAKRLPRNYVGERIGALTILEELESHITPNGSKQRIVKCQCDCGNVFTIRLSSALKNGKCRECLDKERRADITGKRFGKLVVLSMADDYISPSGHRLSRCKCLCDCGNITIVNMSSLVTGSTQSCGCLQNTAGLLKDNPDLVAKYDFEKNSEIGIDFETITARTSEKVWWKCKECGNSWFATVASQNDKIEHGCPYCSGRLVIKGKTDLLTLFPEISKEWDYEKNGDLQPSDISSKSGIKVWWKCSEGHEWKATVGNRAHNNSGCPRCNIENVNSFCEQAVFYYIRKAFPDAINSDQHLGIELDIYIPSIKTAVEYDGEVWHNSEKRKKNDEKKNALCKEAGIRLIRIREPRSPEINTCTVIHRTDSTSNESLNQAIDQLLDVLGSSTINVDIDSDSGVILDQYATKKYENSLSYCYPDIAAEWHPTKNGRLTPDRISKASRRNVWWLGKCGHEWQAVVSERTAPEKILKNGRTKKPYGCPYCSGKRILVGFNDLQSLFPEIAAEWHPTNNGILRPTEISPGSGKKVWWLGKCGHEWQSTPNKRCKDNSQCPMCYREKRSPAVVCIETGQVFNHGIDAAKNLGQTSASHIYKCCRKKVETAFGFHWKYYFPQEDLNRADNR
ncbi:MAG: DUF2726 domain-containing protein [Lachnospiraceae bacterium]|nr:DUF2726 domain-containing protein [Lachnospiraceae bacterium]